MIEYFTEPKSSVVRVKVELDLSNYATKKDFKNAAGIDTSKIAKIVDLANLIFDVDKLKNVPTNLINLEKKVDKLDTN